MEKQNLLVARADRQELWRLHPSEQGGPYRVTAVDGGQVIESDIDQEGACRWLAAHGPQDEKWIQDHINRADDWATFHEVMAEEEEERAQDAASSTPDPSRTARPGFECESQ